MDILEKIVTAKKKSLKEQKNKLPIEEIIPPFYQKSGVPPTQNFLKAISSPGKVHLIAEIKRTSPSGNWYVGNRRWEVGEIALEYEKAGASAISVLTEEKFFLGNLEYLKQVKKICSLPVLRKDFIFDIYQIYESRYYGADAFLLIAALLSRKKIEEFVSLGNDLGMDALVEVHNEKELDRVLDTGVKIIGINNRNLKDLTVDLNVTLRLRKKIPKDKIVISESGIKTKKDVELLKNVGINAVLIGETLMRSKNIKDTVKKLGLGNPSPFPLPSRLAPRSGTGKGRGIR
jgi:indole-3-glycerol phosphate synthase